MVSWVLVANEGAAKHGGGQTWASTGVIGLRARSSQRPRSLCGRHRRSPPISCTRPRPTKLPPPRVHDWTGFYIGGHGGWAWTDKTWTDALSGTNHLISDNGIGGGQVGFNWQTGAWVIGVEAQASWTHIRKGWIDPDPEPFWTKGGRPVGVARVGTTVDHFGTIAARFGYAFDRSLIFVKGGGAWAHDIYRATDEDTQTPLARADDTRWGWMRAQALNTPSSATGRPRSSSTTSGSAPRASPMSACPA